MKIGNEREVAVFALIDILDSKGYNNIVLKRTLNQNKNLSSIQKALVTQIVNGTLKNLIHLDYIINYFSKTKTTKMKPLILNTLRISVYQIKFIDKIPYSAVCNEAVNLVKSKGFKNLSGFINGVLRNTIRNIDNIEYPSYEKDPINYISTKYSYPIWLVEYFMEFMNKDEIENLCARSNDAPKMTISANTTKITRDALIEKLKNEGMEATKGELTDKSIYISKTANILDSPSFKDGLFHIIDESSMVAVESLCPKEGDIVYDLCSAPGGKSFYAAYLMNNKGIIESCDIYPHKLNLVEESAKRLGIEIINTYENDATKHYSDKIGKADCVLIDAPCTGFGLLRKKPDIKYTKTKDDIYALAKVQREILSKSYNYVKIGGTLVYSTCTISEEENIKNVDWFTKNYDYEVCHTKQFLPSTSNTDGFFIAKMIRKG